VGVRDWLAAVDVSGRRAGSSSVYQAVEKETVSRPGLAGLTTRAGLGRGWGIVREVPMLPVVLIGAGLLALSVDGFATAANGQIIMRQLAVLVIAATGETLVLLIAGIDLSVGSVIGLGSVLGTSVILATGSPTLGLLVCVGTGALIGAFNGLTISRLGVPPMILTLGTMLTARATAFLVTGGRSIGGLPADVLEFGRADWLGVPTVFVISAGAALLVAFILNRTVFGQSIYLVGSNERAAAFSGIPVRRVKFLVYFIGGILSGLASFVFLLRIGAAMPTAGDPLLLLVIGSVVVGGTSLMGGEGGVFRTVTGAALIMMIVNGLSLIGASYYVQDVVSGVVIVVGSALGVWLVRARTGE